MVSITKNVRARPEGYWNSTGVNIRVGDKVTVRYVGGSWRSNPHWGPTDAGGDDRYIAGPSYLCPGAPQGSLIGKVGGDNSGGGSNTFPIGNLGVVPAGLEGALWLTVNDEPNGFGDNTGSLSVEIAVG